MRNRSLHVFHRDQRQWHRARCRGVDRKPGSHQRDEGIAIHVLQGNFQGCVKDGRSQKAMTGAARFERRNGGGHKKTSQSHELSSGKGHYILQCGYKGG